MYSRFFFDANDGIPNNKLNRIISKYGADNILVGIDPGEDDRPSDVAQPMFDYLKDNNVAIHVYLVGPGMMSWSSQERNQIKKFARSIGIDVNAKNWHNEWIDWGWKAKVIEQFEYYYKEYNAYSCEIDNLDSGLKSNEYIDFFLELKIELQKRNVQTKLFLKNLDDDQLNDLFEKFKEGEITLDNICEYAIFEKGTGSPKHQLMMCEKMGIQAITPLNGLKDTYHYGVVDSGIPYEVDENNVWKNKNV